jgi:hypothetical protein
MRSRPFIFILAVCAPVSMVAFGLWLIAGSSRPTAHASLVTRNASKAEEILLRAAPPKPLQCPESHGAPLQASPHTGHHKVILTWNASAPSPDPTRQAVGYCLYRSGTQNVAKQDPKCSSCEQINRKPVSGTACVDDLVQDGARYYYVATAINGNGDTSSLSNDTLAEIPSSTQVKGSVAAVSYPRCRADNGSR